jgi:hypothetical protein
MVKKIKNLMTIITIIVFSIIAIASNDDKLKNNKNDKNVEYEKNVEDDNTMTGYEVLENNEITYDPNGPNGDVQLDCPTDWIEDEGVEENYNSNDSQ